MSWTFLKTFLAIQIAWISLAWQHEWLSSEELHIKSCKEHWKFFNLSSCASCIVKDLWSNTMTCTRRNPNLTSLWHCPSFAPKHCYGFQSPSITCFKSDVHMAGEQCQTCHGHVMEYPWSSFMQPRGPKVVLQFRKFSWFLRTKLDRWKFNKS